MELSLHTTPYNTRNFLQSLTLVIVELEKEKKEGRVGNIFGIQLSTSSSFDHPLF
jgi:hypothetical protein